MSDTSKTTSRVAGVPPLARDPSRRGEAAKAGGRASEGGKTAERVPPSERQISIRGARVHNLKNVDLDIPRDKLVVFTGLSGSGKSSLAFDTIYAEGQRRYVESLSAYARQFLDVAEKPDVDSIDGLSPAIAIDQKSTSRNPRSTVGTVTEVWDYLRLLFAKIGRPHCPHCGAQVSSQSPAAITDEIASKFAGRKIVLLAPVVRGKKGEHKQVFSRLRADGFARVRADGEIRGLDEDLTLDAKKFHDVEVVVDRIVPSAEERQRLAEAVESALKLGDEEVWVLETE